MDREEILSDLKKRGESDDDIETFLNLYDSQKFKNDIEMRFAYGKYFVERYGTHAVVEWDSDSG